MIRQYLLNNNETVTVVFRRKFYQLYSPSASDEDERRRIGEEDARAESDGFVGTRREAAPSSHRIHTDHTYGPPGTVYDDCVRTVQRAPASRDDMHAGVVSSTARKRSQGCVHLACEPKIFLLLSITSNF
jgi:hypothetical protein